VGADGPQGTEKQLTTGSAPNGVRIVTGAPAELESAFLERVAEVRARDPLAPVDVLVGGVLMKPYLQRLLADTTPGLVNVRISTLGEFGLRLGEPALASAGRRPLSVVADRALAREVARACTGYFAPVASTPGFADALRRTASELRQEGVSPDALARHAPNALESPEKAADFADLYQRYHDARAGWYDAVDALQHADAAHFDGVELLLVGVWRLAAGARGLLARLAERVPVVVFLPALDPDADQAHAELRAWLLARGAETTRLEPAAAATALGRLKERLFAPGAPIAGDGSVDLVSAPDPVAETREAARACLGWAASGIAFREMAVSFRQAEVYRPLIEAVFAEAGIPIYLHDGPALAERPLGRRLLALLDLIGSPLRRRDVMAVLSDGPLPRAARDRFGGAPAARWDSISRRAGIVEGLDQWRERLALLLEAERAAAAADDAPEWRAQRVADTESLIAFVDELGGRLARHPERSTWGEALDALRPLLTDYVEGAEGVLDLLDRLRELDRIVPQVDFRHVLEVVRAEVRALRAGDLEEGQQGAFGRRGVSVLDVNQLRNLRFRAVAVLGLAERSFPPPPRQDPLLLDEERRRLNAAGGWCLPLRAQGADPEPLQFALAVHAAREALFLSTPRAEEPGGRPQFPSSFFRLAAAALAGRRIAVDETAELPFVRRLRAGRVGSDDPDRSLTLAERDRSLLETDVALGRALLERLEPRAARAGALRRARWSDRTLTAFDGTFSDADAIAALAARLDTDVLSPTGLETYAICPFRYFLEHVVRVRPLEEPEQVLRIDPLTRGGLVHRVLQRFMEEAPRPLERARADEHRAALLQIAEEELAGAEARGLTGTPLLWDADRREILDDLVTWLEREIADTSDFPSCDVEVSFGRTDARSATSALTTSSPLVLSAGGRSLRLGGRIDRLDHGSGEAFRVIDYKTGSGRELPRDGRLRGGRALQLPLYLLAGAMILGVGPASGVAAYHLVSRRGNFRRISFSGEDLAARRDDLDGVLARIAGGIAGGDFHPEPDRSTCRYCNYDDLCDVGRERIAARKAEDPSRVSFAAMREVE